MTNSREYWDLELKNQSKTRMARINQAIQEFGGIIHDQHENNYFPKQKWRNPILYRISLPKGKRFAFIVRTKEWLHRPPKIGIPSLARQKPHQLKGNHDELQFLRVRHYRIDPSNSAYVKNCRTGKVLKGQENVARVFSGELDLIIG